MALRHDLKAQIVDSNSVLVSKKRHSIAILALVL